MYLVYLGLAQTRNTVAGRGAGAATVVVVAAAMGAGAGAGATSAVVGAAASSSDVLERAAAGAAAAPDERDARSGLVGVARARRHDGSDEVATWQVGGDVAGRPLQVGYRRS